MITSLTSLHFTSLTIKDQKSISFHFHFTFTSLSFHFHFTSLHFTSQPKTHHFSLHSLSLHNLLTHRTCKSSPEWLLGCILQKEILLNETSENQGRGCPLRPPLSRRPKTQQFSLQFHFTSCTITNQQVGCEVKKVGVVRILVSIKHVLIQRMLYEVNGTVLYWLSRHATATRPHIVPEGPFHPPTPLTYIFSPPYPYAEKTLKNAYFCKSEKKKNN